MSSARSRLALRWESSRGAFHPPDIGIYRLDFTSLQVRSAMQPHCCLPKSECCGASEPDSARERYRGVLRVAKDKASRSGGLRRCAYRYMFGPL